MWRPERETQSSQRRDAVERQARIARQLRWTPTRPRRQRSEPRSIRCAASLSQGAATPLAADVETSWSRLLAGKSGIRRLPDAVVGDLPAKIGGVMPTREDDPSAGFDPNAVMAPKDQRKVDRFILFGLAAISPHDIISPVEVGEYVRDHIAGNRVVLLNATSHCPNLSAPEAVTAAIRPFCLILAPAGRRTTGS
jgi:pimeloyl-ACP methyl ester carboxylesterase